MDLKMKKEIFIFVVLFRICTTQTGIRNYTDNLGPFLQPNNVGDRYWFTSSEDQTSCTRVCLPYVKSRICYYEFHLENYVTQSQACSECMTTGKFCDHPECVTADGFKRNILTVNRRFPGPSIQVCQGDRIIVDVINHVPGTSFTIHWHGIHQHGTPYHDGVPQITQCPITEASIYRYDFYASNYGTLFWHSHEGIHKLNGIQGSLIVRQSTIFDVNRKLYDDDLPAHVIFISDWLHDESAMLNPGDININNEIYYLINGHGRFEDPKTGTTTKSPYHTFRVIPRRRYRFRIVAATSMHCAVRLSIEEHSFRIIAADGKALKMIPEKAYYVDLHSGERYDIVLSTNNVPKSYWIKVIGLGSACKKYEHYQLAILKYEGSKEYPKSKVNKVDLYNTNREGLNTVNSSAISKLSSAEPYDNSMMLPWVDVSFRLSITDTRPAVFKFVTDEEFSYATAMKKYMRFQINKIAHKVPPAPILSQRDDIPIDALCTENHRGVPECKENVCHCLQILRVPLGKVVQLLLMDETKREADIGIPFHLHGLDFIIYAMGQMKEIKKVQIDQFQDDFKFPAALGRAPLKDTVAIPPKGYIVIRFKAINPGYWLFHSNILGHQENGMALVVQVGDRSDIPPVPNGFPTCGMNLEYRKYRVIENRIRQRDESNTKKYAWHIQRV